MPESSLYKPTADLAPSAPPLQNDQEGVAITVVQPPWERYLKQAMATVVIGCGAALPFLSPTSDHLAWVACSMVVAIGAGLGITSRGNQPKQ